MGYANTPAVELSEFFLREIEMEPGMKAELEELGPIKKRLAIEVPADEVRRETEELLRNYRRKARLPGFRAGKAPLDLVRKRFGADLREEVRERILSRSFHAAVEREGLRPVGDPAVADLEFEDDGPLSFTATFEVLPRIEPRAYKDVTLARRRPVLGEADVERALEELRQSRARLEVDEGREAGAGDVVVADFEGTPRGGGSPFRRERMPIEVGADNNLPAFNEQLAGVRAGAAIAFAVDYPADYRSQDLAGKTVDFQLNVHEVKRRVVPALDDEFARDLGSFADLAALSRRVREDLEARQQGEERRAVRQAVLDKVLIENPVALPEVLVEREVRHRLEDVVRGMMLQGGDPEKAEIDWEALRKRQEEPSRKVVHAGLTLDAIAVTEGLEVERSAIDERIRQDAARLGEPPDKLRERLHKQGGMEALRSQMLRERALDYLISVANIQYSE